MNFRDTSAVLPLILDESSTPGLRERFRDDGALVVWWATRTEAVSALARLQRAGDLSHEQLKSRLSALTDLLNAATIVHPISAVADRAERLLFSHVLRAADALQLAAALVAVTKRPQGMGFVSLDQRLRIAAEREGFTLIP